MKSPAFFIHPICDLYLS